MSTQKKAGPAGILLVGIVFLTALYIISAYNTLVRLDQQVQAQWAQVENAYQRRLDLVPNLVEAVKGAAGFEKSTYLAVTEARAKAGQTSAGSALTPTQDPARFAQFQQAQEGLSSALSRMMVVVERYPDLKGLVKILPDPTLLRTPS